MAVDIFPVWGRFTVSAGGTGALTLTRIANYPDMEDVLTSGQGFAYTITTLAGLPLETGIGSWTSGGGFVREIVTARMVAGEIVFENVNSNIPSGSILVAILDAQSYAGLPRNARSQNWVAQGQIIGTTANGGVTISSGTITLNLGAFNSFDLGTLTAGSYTLAAPSGLASGVSYKGDIKLTNPSSGTVVFAYSEAWDFEVGTAITVPTTTNAVVFFDYSSHSATNVRLSTPRVFS